jgi:nicotinamidase-related amidase
MSRNPSVTRRTDAFTNTGLDLWLRRRGIEHLIVAGIRTELVLNERFARIVSVDACLAGLGKA